MTLTEELTWRGFVNQTTYPDGQIPEGQPITFYFGVDPSANSMQVGNLAAAMMVRKFIQHGHKAIILVGGATGMIGDPDGKADERSLKTLEQIELNKRGIAAQYDVVFDGMPFTFVDSYASFKDFSYLDFLRTVGKHVPMSQMLGRDFISSRLGEGGSGISYAEFSYALIQAYDFLWLKREHGATLQIAGADQWGNSVAGVDLIRRIDGDEAHVWSLPLVVNKRTGVKFGKSEGGAVWLDPAQTTPTQFYQFWINTEDDSLEDFLKIFTEYDQAQIADIMAAHVAEPGARSAHRVLAESVTTLVHGADQTAIAQSVTACLVDQTQLSQASESIIASIRQEIPAAQAKVGGSVLDVLVQTELASSVGDARRLLQANAISINGQKIDRDTLQHEDFIAGRLLLKKGKKFRDSALVETPRDAI